MKDFYPAFPTLRAVTLAWGSIMVIYVGILICLFCTQHQIDPFLLFLAVIGLIFLWIAVRSNRYGLYLNESGFTFLRLHQRAHLYDDIFAIVIQPTTISGAHGGTTHLSKTVWSKGTRTKEPLYTLFLMSKHTSFRVTQWVKNSGIGSEAFECSFREDCLGYALYRKELLDHLLQKNPDIVVLGDDFLI